MAKSPKSPKSSLNKKKRNNKRRKQADLSYEDTVELIKYVK